MDIYKYMNWFLGKILEKNLLLRGAHNGLITHIIGQNPLKKGLKKPKFCINFVSQPSNDLISSIFKCLENLQTLVLESIWMGIT